VLLTMYYDLMSYLAQSYARSVSVGLTLLQARTTVVAQIVNLLALADLAPFHDIIKIMIVIAKKKKKNHVVPAPPPPPPMRQQPTQRSRFSCAVMSPPPAGYFPLSNSDTEEEEENEDEDAAEKQRKTMRVLPTMMKTHTRHTRHRNIFEIKIAFLSRFIFVSGNPYQLEI
jgi:hypothetical protein